MLPSVKRKSCKKYELIVKYSQRSLDTEERVLAFFKEFIYLFDRERTSSRQSEREKQTGVMT